MSLPIPTIANHLDGRDLITVGNTAGTLSVLIEIDDQRLLLGAGPTRSHAADFVGRSTRPWDRQIDLLIIPSADTTHATGALGLLERRDVSGIAVVGVPGDEAIWTLLEREAATNSVPVRYLDGVHRLELAPNVSITMAPFGADDKRGTIIRIDYRGARVDIVEASGAHANRQWLPSSVPSRNNHMLIEMNGAGAGLVSDPALVIRPQPFTTDDFDENDDGFVAEIRRNDRLTLQLADDEIRLPFDEIDFRGGSTPARARLE